MVHQQHNISNQPALPDTPGSFNELVQRTFKNVPSAKPHTGYTVGIYAPEQRRILVVNDSQGLRTPTDQSQQQITEAMTQITRCATEYPTTQSTYRSVAVGAPAAYGYLAIALILLTAAAVIFHLSAYDTPRLTGTPLFATIVAICAGSIGYAVLKTWLTLRHAIRSAQAALSLLARSTINEPSHQSIDSYGRIIIHVTATPPPPANG